MVLGRALHNLVQDLAMLKEGCVGLPYTGKVTCEPRETHEMQQQETHWASGRNFVAFVTIPFHSLELHRGFLGMQSSALGKAEMRGFES